MRWKSGQKALDGLCVKGKQHGKWVWFERDGTIRRVVWFDMGVENRVTEAQFKAKYPGLWKKMARDTGAQAGVMP